MSIAPILRQFKNIFMIFFTSNYKVKISVIKKTRSKQIIKLLGALGFNKDG